MLYEPIWSAPRVTVTALGAQRLNAVTGLADHCRHEWQWQYPMASGFPATQSSTAPQKQRPLYSFSVGMMSSLQGG